MLIKAKTGCGLPKTRCQGKYLFAHDLWRMVLRPECQKCIFMLRKKA